MRRLATLSLLALAACAGYNANYKANHYAADARKLDAEGRTVEAGGYWNRAFVKAESILARSPNGRYAANANAIRGEAFAALGQCPSAVRVLPGAIETLKSQESREQATLSLGLCEIALGTPGLAITTVTPVTESKSSGRRRLARLLLGTAQRQVGDYPAALASLEGLPGVIAQAQRLYAHAGLHDSVAAHATFDSLLALRDSTLPWDSLLTVTGREDPLIASSLLDQLRGGEDSLPQSHRCARVRRRRAAGHGESCRAAAGIRGHHPAGRESGAGRPGAAGTGLPRCPGVAAGAATARRP